MLAKLSAERNYPTEVYIQVKILYELIAFQSFAQEAKGFQADGE